MQPSARALIEAIIRSIDEVVIPVVTDKVAASSLRSARTLLDHLARRVDGEADMLRADNADALAVCSAIAARVGHQAVPVIAAFLEAGPDESPQGMTPQARNEAMQKVIDATLRGLPPAGAQTGEAAEIRAMLRDYLDRRLAREREMIFPAFLGPPF
jgi:thioredoxin-like negative regulator of GroEL